MKTAEDYAIVIAEKNSWDEESRAYGEACSIIDRAMTEAAAFAVAVAMRRLARKLRDRAATAEANGYDLAYGAYNHAASMAEVEAEDAT